MIVPHYQKQSDNHFVKSSNAWFIFTSVNFKYFEPIAYSFHIAFPSRILRLIM